MASTPKPPSRPDEIPATQTPDTPTPPFLEIPLFTRSSLLPAINAGCRRIELNATGSYSAGGTTPSTALVRAVSSDLASLPFPVALRVMIRPRGGDFVYSAAEAGQIHSSMAELKPLLDPARGDGFVFGALRRRRDEDDDDGSWSLDAELCTSVVAWAAPLPVVFHRAFDEAVGSDGGPQVEAMLALIQRIGFRGLLTSGGVGNARDNLAVLRRVVRRFVSGQVEVVVGGGVRGANVGDIFEELSQVSGARVVYHSSCLSEPGRSEEVDVEEVRSIVRVWMAEGTDPGAV